MTDGFAIGALYIRYFGILLMLGVVSGAWLTTYFVKQRGQDTDFVWDMLVNLVVGGIIGARLWHIFTPTNSAIEQGLTTQFYLTHPLDILAIWDGGLGVIGAVLGGTIALWLYARSNQISFFEWADFLAPGVALGQAIGRLADFFNQQIYGWPTNLPWKIFIDAQHRLRGFENTEYYHPLFAYESILDFVNLLLLIWLVSKKQESIHEGELFIIYILNYSIIRFVLEFMRLDPALIMGYNINQVVALAGIILSMALLVLRRNKAK